MKILVIVIILTYYSLAINASFFTWVAETINPILVKLFPETYHPILPKTVPVYRRMVKKEENQKTMNPPRYYIDQTNTIKNLKPSVTPQSREWHIFRETRPQPRIVTGVTRSGMHPREWYSSRSTERLPHIVTSVTRPERMDTNNITCDRCQGNKDKYIFTPDRVRCHGYVAQNHTVYTEDGYILTVFRITPLKNTTQFREPVLLHHGLLGSSDDWLLLGKNRSLAYKLVDAGYDVWLTNARGNIYSKGHINKKSTRYWMFSWQEIGQYDLPAVIDYIMLLVNDESSKQYGHLNYIGHSMGATALLVLLSTKPEYNDKIRIATLLAPLAFMNHELNHLQELAKFSAKYPSNMIEVLGDGDSAPSKELPSWWVDDFNEQCTSGDAMCANALFFIAGPILGAWEPCLRADVLRHVPAGGSLNTIAHYAQCSIANSFQQSNGSEFQLDHVTAPLVIICSQTDVLSLESDVHKLYFSLANPVSYQVIRSIPFSHTEFVWGSKADEVVYDKLIMILRNGYEL